MRRRVRIAGGAPPSRDASGRQGLAAVHPRGLYAAESDRFAATLRGPDGTVLRVLRRAHEPARASRADVAARR